MMGRRRDSHRQRELTDYEGMDLRGWLGGQFESQEDRRRGWEANRDQLMERGESVPGHRPQGFWDYDADDAPDPNDFLIPLEWGPEDERRGAVRVDRDALEEARLRYLAERGLLDQEEIARLAAEAEEPYHAPDGVHRPGRRFDAVLDGLSKPAARCSGGAPLPDRPYVARVGRALSPPRRRRSTLGYDNERPRRV